MTRLSLMAALLLPSVVFATPGSESVASLQPRRPPLLRVAMHDLKKEGDVAERTVNIVSEALLSEIRKLEHTGVIGMREIGEMLSFEAQRQLLGCDDQSCIEEIGGALGVDEIVTGGIGRLGGTSMLTIRRPNVIEARVVGSFTRRVEAKDGEELLTLIGEAVETLYPGVPVKEGRMRGASIEAAKRLNPPPLPKWVFFTTAGAAAASLLASGAFGYAQWQASEDYRAAGDRSIDQPVSGVELRAIEERSAWNARARDISFLVGGGLVVAAVVEAFFTDWQGYGAIDGSTPSLVVVPTGNGIGAVARF